MRYKTLVQGKVSIVANLAHTIETMIYSNVTREEVKAKTQQIKELLDEIQSLLDKENQQ